MDSGPDKYFLVLEVLVEFLDIGPFSVGPEEGFEERVVPVLIYVVVNNFDGLVLFHMAKISC
jgi:hypothetical protein